MEVSENQKEYLKKINDIVEKIRQTSRFMIVANNQYGKTEVAMYLLRAIMERPEHAENKIVTKFFDPAINLRFKFDKIPFVDRTKVTHVPLAQDLIVDIPFNNSTLKRDAIMEVLNSDFIHKRQLKILHNGTVPFYNFYIVDEMQNVWGSTALRRRDNENAMTVFSEGSNYGMIIIGIAQRFADVSTAIVERCAYFMVGRLSGSNELTRLAKMIDNNEKVMNKVRGLKRGDFIFIDKENPEFSTKIEFNRFEQIGKPYELTEERPTDCYGKVRELF